VGPTAHSLLAGRGLEVMSELTGTDGNPMPYHAARMPLATLVVAGLTTVVGDRIAIVSIIKTILFLIPIWMAMWIVLSASLDRSASRIRVLLLLVLPFTATVFLADVVNLQVEEGYSYSLLALAFSMLVFHRIWLCPAEASTAVRLGRSILFAVTVSGLYLAKSSMILVALVLLWGFISVNRNNVERAIVILIIGLTPILWATHQHEVSGRYSVGTSLDGINFHKGNNAKFLDRYPPPPPTNLDLFDDELSVGQRFSNEWQFNDFHVERALEWARDNPGQELRAVLVKLQVIFLSIEHYGTNYYQGLRGLIDTEGMVLFRLLFSAALVYAIWVLFARTGDERFVGLLFVAVVISSVMPYVIGFAYTRHFVILLYPAVTVLCRAQVTRAQVTKP
jgi:hypothetical protein